MPSLHYRLFDIVQLRQSPIYAPPNFSRWTAKNVKLHSCRTLLSVDVTAPNGTAWNLSSLYDQDQTSWLSCALFASSVSQRLLYADKTLLWRSVFEQKSVTSQSVSFTSA